MREFKGKSLLALPKNFVVIDIETTGLDSEFDDIIEICAVRYENFKKIDMFSSLIHSTLVDEFITDLTGITKAMLKDAPKIEKVLPQLDAFLKKDDILLAHNANFDINFLYDMFSSVLNKQFSFDFVDTMRLSRKLNPQLRHRLVDLCERYKIENKGAHRAQADCEATFLCFQALKDEINAKFDNVDDFLKSQKLKVQAKDIHSNKQEFDEEHFLFNKKCVITGELKKFKRKEAMQMIADCGGINQDNVTKQTNCLIIGSHEYCHTIKNGKSTKQKRAEELILKGNDLIILTENVFYDVLQID